MMNSGNVWRGGAPEKAKRANPASAQEIQVESLVTTKNQRQVWRRKSLNK